MICIQVKTRLFGEDHLPKLRGKMKMELQSDKDAEQ